MQYIQCSKNREENSFLDTQSGSVYIKKKKISGRTGLQMLKNSIRLTNMVSSNFSVIARDLLLNSPQFILNIHFVWFCCSIPHILYISDPES